MTDVPIVVGLLTQLRAAGLPEPEAEYVFAPPRKWRFDYCWPDPAVRLAVEVEGGTRSGGRHVRPQGYEDDCEKYNEAALLGWRVIRVTTGMVQSGEALALVERALRDVGES